MSSRQIVLTGALHCVGILSHGKPPHLPGNRLATVRLQVDRMVSDAEKFSEEDKKQREAVDIRNSVRPARLLCTDP